MPVQFISLKIDCVLAGLDISIELPDPILYPLATNLIEFRHLEELHLFYPLKPLTLVLLFYDICRILIYSSFLFYHWVSVWKYIW